MHKGHQCVTNRKRAGGKSGATPGTRGSVTVEGEAMHFKIDRSVFLNELHSLQGVAGSKQVIPILAHVLIETRTDRIVLRATDLDLTITTECEAYVREKGTSCLPSRKLMEIVKSLAHGEIEIKVNELNQAAINSNGSRFKLKGEAADNF